MNARDLLRRSWPALLLAGVVLVMLLIRLQTYGTHLGGERAYLIGPDAYFHAREVMGIVQSFPHVPRWDPWTNYPHGTWTGQFGTPFDVLAALVVLVFYGRGATEEQVVRVLGVYPAVLGALLAIPMYFLARRLLGRPGAVVASVVLALLPGQFVTRSVVGYADHHVAEALTLALSVLALVVAVDQADAAAKRLRQAPRSPASWAPLGWAVLAGAALALEVLVWSPALLFVAVLAAWVGVMLLVASARGQDVVGIAAAGAVAFASAGLFLLPFVETHALFAYFGQLNDSNVAPYDLLHVVLCLAAAGGVALVFAATEVARRRKAPAWAAPAALAGIAASVLALALLLPGVGPEVVQALSWVSGTGGSRTLVTIAEVQPTDILCTSDTVGATTFSYCMTAHVGLLPLLSLGILLAVAVAAARKGDRRDLLLVLLGAVVLVASLSQFRFTYYFAVTIPLLVGWLAAKLIGSPATRSAVGLLGRRKAAASPGYDAGRVAAVCIGLALVLPASLVTAGASALAWHTEGTKLDPNLVDWTDAALWMRSHTPDAGVDLGGVYGPPAPGETFAYPPQTYAVLAWWEDGHYLETLARRPPIANPFQQGASEAAVWYTESDPGIADARLQEMGARYVFVDERTSTALLGALLPWAHAVNESRPESPRALQAQVPYAWPNGTTQVLTSTLRGPYGDTMQGRLFDGDGRGLSHLRLVWVSAREDVVGSQSHRGRTCIHRPVHESCPSPVTLEAARSYKPGTIEVLPDGAVAWDLQVVNTLMLYERVAGAHLVGHATPGANVTAEATLVAGNRTFVHEERAVADETGRYDIVFPYSTRDLVPVEDGGTETDVRADGSVRVTMEGRTLLVEVPDDAVLKGNIVEVTS